jgi:site-specific DNA-methyltransferase (adenine-specific)
VSAPEPYYDDGQVQLFVGDCREVLPALGVEADLVLADPPYGETSLAWDRWPDGWLKVAATVSRSLWCFGSMRMLGEHWQEFTGAGWKFSQDVIWEKHNGSSRATDRFKRVHEMSAHWYHGRWDDVYHEAPRTEVHYRTKSASGSAQPRHTGKIGSAPWVDDGTRITPSVISVRSMQHGAAIHPTEKPLGILMPLIGYGCRRDGLVVDPFAGSGSTLDAARSTGRRAIGIEAREDYAELAARRLSQATLFGGAA